jgi:hypothetical protein
MAQTWPQNSPSTNVATWQLTANGLGIPKNKLVISIGSGRIGSRRGRKLF